MTYLEANPKFAAELSQMCRESGTPLRCANGTIRHVIGAPKHMTTMAEFVAHVQAQTKINQRRK